MSSYTVYLCVCVAAAVQILPGKVEFSYLPINCQSVLVLPAPVPPQSAAPPAGAAAAAAAAGADADADDEAVGAIVVGTNQAKNLKFADLNRIRSAASVFCSMIE